MKMEKSKGCNLTELVVVTGASRGLGLAIAETLVKANYRVVAIARTQTIELQSLMHDFCNQIFFVEFDFRETKDIHELVLSISRDHGAIYGLVNNAAIGHDGVLGTMHERDISELIKVNIEAPVLMSKYALRSMLSKQRGRIVNIGSIISNTGFNGLSVYGATKSSLVGFTKSLARELGRASITVNTVSPGYMETAMTSGLNEEHIASIKRRSPMGRLPTVSDVACAVRFLLSSDASNITGTSITVDAGSTA